MKNAMSLKAIVKNIAKQKGITAQLVLQNYFLERLLERISYSNYKSYLILKGGFLIASIVGLDTRTTMDMDVTIKGQSLTEEHLLLMFKEIIDIPIEDNIKFEIKSIHEIRENDEYNGYRIHLIANYEVIAVPLKIDITTGDKITPKEIQYQFPMMFSESKISVLAYNLETVLAEKLETILSRGDQTTRSRDFYDVYIIWKLHYRYISKVDLLEALIQTSLKRNSYSLLNSYKEIVNSIQISPKIYEDWKRYQNTYQYAKDIKIEDICSLILEILFEINLEDRIK